MNKPTHYFLVVSIADVFHTGKAQIHLFPSDADLTPFKIECLNGPVFQEKVSSKSLSPEAISVTLALFLERSQFVANIEFTACEMMLTTEWNETEINFLLTRKNKSVPYPPFELNG